MTHTPREGASPLAKNLAIIGAVCLILCLALVIYAGFPPPAIYYGPYGYLWAGAVLFSIPALCLASIALLGAAVFVRGSR